MSEQLALLPGLATAHMQLTLLALLCGVSLSIPLGIAATRIRALEGPIALAAGIVQTIPALALLALMVPLLAALGLRSIGFLPALLGLVLYSVLPILRNTIAGLRGVDVAMIEAARGVGMRPLQQLLRVELPLALPVIVAGLRTATVWTVGMATLSTPVGAPSLGNFIFSGLQTRNLTAVLVGCVAASLLALLLDGLVGLLECGVRERRRHLVAVVGALGIGLYAFVGFGMLRERIVGGQEPIRVGTKSFTEQHVLGELLALRMAATSSTPVTILPSLGSTVAFDALRDGSLDLYVEYSGTIWATILQRDALPDDRTEVLAQVRTHLRREYDVDVLAALGFENTYVLAMREAQAQDLGIAAIGDLAPLAPRLAAGGDYEFFGRQEWANVVDRYGLHFRELRTMDPALMYQAVARGNVDVIGAYSTDPRIASFELRTLRDDRGAIPPYDAVVLATVDFAERHPRAAAALRALDGAIDAEAMRAANLAVDRDGIPPRSAAEALFERVRELDPTKEARLPSAPARERLRPGGE